MILIRLQSVDFLLALIPAFMAQWKAGFFTQGFNHTHGNLVVGSQNSLASFKSRILFSRKNNQPGNTPGNQ